MGLFYKSSLTCGGILGIWEITETPEKLCEMIFNQLSISEKENYQNLKHPGRKSEWLAARVLLKEVFDNYVHIFYDKYGKPFLKNGYNISISHSDKLVAIVLSKTSEVGIDIQKMSDKIAKIALKFLNPDEFDSLCMEKRIQHLYANWCAKETLMKIYGKAYIDFKKNIKILPFKFKDEGQFTGKIEIESTKKEYHLNYQTISFNHAYYENYMMVWYCGVNNCSR